MTTRHGGNIPTEAGAGGGGSGLTSVDVALTGYTSDGPLVADGTITMTEGAQSGNKVKASPSNGGSGVPAYRALVSADIPSLSATYQPLDADLTAIAALTTASAGRDVLTATTAAEIATKAGVGTGDSPQFTAVNVGHATDSTVTRSAAGKLAVEGKAIPLMSGSSDLVLAGPTTARTWTGPDADATLLYSGGALGTPASGTLTNATGLPASALVSGIIPEATYLGLAAGLSADGKWCGLTVEGTAGAALAFGEVCYLNTTPKWVKAKADAASTSGDVQLGICVLAAAADGNATRMLLFGTIRADSAFPTFTVGATVHLSSATAGATVVAAPTTTDHVTRRLGFALTADSFMFNPSNDYYSHV